MKAMQPEPCKISVIMPVYNGKAWLATAVESVLSQEVQELELLLVDDGSTDGSADLCDEAAKKDARVRVWHRPNGGICNARNFGLEQARGEFVAFCDDDDAYRPGYLARACEFAVQCNADLVRMGYRLLHETTRGQTVEGPHAGGKEHILHFGDGGAAYDDFLRDCGPQFIWNALYRKSALGKLRFDPACSNGLEDFQFNARFWASPKLRTAVYVPKLAYLHFERRSGTSSARDAEALAGRFGVVSAWMQAELQAAEHWCAPRELDSVWNERKACAVTFMMHQQRDAALEAKAARAAWSRLRRELNEIHRSKPFDFLRIAGHNRKQMAAMLLYETRLERLYSFLSKSGDKV